MGKTKIAVAIVLASVTGGCTSTPPAPAQDMAILDWSGSGDPAVLAIDGRKPERGVEQSRLPPGRHEIAYGGWFGVSVLSDASGVRSYEQSATLDLKAAHVYATRRERVYRLMQQPQDYLWIEDVATGEVLAGSFPPGDRSEIARREHARDDREAQERFETLLAAASCDAAASGARLGAFYLAGEPPLRRRDLAQAFAWYSRAEAGGDASAGSIRARIAAELTPTERDEAERLLTAPTVSCARGQP